MPRPKQKKKASSAQRSLTGLEPPAMKAAKKVDPVDTSLLVLPEPRPRGKVKAEVAFIEPPDPDAIEIPEQKEHFQLPTRFGAVPVDEAPLGWEVETRRREVKVTKFQHAYPTIRLPFQEVQRVEFGHGDQFAHSIRERERERERERVKSSAS